MSNEETSNQHDRQGRQGHPEGPDPRYGGWEPTPQGDGFDADAAAADATAFVHLPPEDLANIPLAAPGHGYVPPMILPLTPAAGLDPAATGSWVLQTQTQQAQAEQRAQEAAAREAAAQEAGAVHWPDPNQQGGQGGYQGPYQDTSHATAQWNFTEALGGASVAPEATGAPEAQIPDAGHLGHPDPEVYAGHTDHTDHTGHAGHVGDTGPIDHTAHAGPTDHTAHTGQAGHTGHTGQWTIPVADGDLPDESGEFLASAHTPQWYTDSARPATLPGGAPAPWATPEPEPVADPVPVADRTPETATGDPAAGEPATGEPTTDDPATREPAERAARTADAEPGATTTADIEGRAAEETGEAGKAEEAGEAGEAGTASDAAPAPETDANVDAAPDTLLDAAPDATSEAAPEAAPEADPAPVLLDAPSEHPSASYLLHVNGVDRPVSDAWIGESLLYVLRERLGLAGAKDGCSQGECGACNVQVDGRLVASCLVPAATAAGSEVRTVEGLAVDGEPSDVQRALSACGAVQCGFCIPGMAMTVHDLLEGNHAPTELETRQALCGNLCRCSGYRGVLDAVADVVAAREANAEATAVPEEARIPQQAEPGAGGVQQGPHPHEGEAL
ncbi:2Fe-2S iron-sulfur cluster-binding protein [Streptomyces anulatus]|uniref:2Fe-2S iron-sulfur cluster-binding protein n=1 Tax=Streptomyces anulatus TaxID=1892 RepID=UPI0033265114